MNVPTLPFPEITSHESDIKILNTLARFIQGFIHRDLCQKRLTVAAYCSLLKLCQCEQFFASNIIPFYVIGHHYIFISIFHLYRRPGFAAGADAAVPRQGDDGGRAVEAEEGPRAAQAHPAEAPGQEAPQEGSQHRAPRH